MRKLNALLIVAAVLVASQGIVLAGGWLPVQTFTSEPGVQRQKFISVEGADLKSKLASAAEHAHSENAPFWTAFSYDMRSGVAIDMGMQDYDASADAYARANVDSIASTDTRQLSVFLLHSPDGNTITRLEIYDLSRQRDYDCHRVYWLGHIKSDDSLRFFQNIAETYSTPYVAERAIIGISLHDDTRVPSILKNYARASSNARVRETAILWLGQVGGEQSFLVDLVRDEQERTEVRKRAALALGIGKDRTALATIQNLYESVTQPEVKKQLRLAASLREKYGWSRQFSR